VHEAAIHTTLPPIPLILVKTFRFSLVTWAVGSVSLAMCHAVELISADPITGKSVKGTNTEPALSSDGRFVVFTSTARLTADDTNVVSDVYLKDRVAGTLERISDERGGDQPILSGSGRKVVFRALDAFPKLRLVDREFDRMPRTISYPFGGGRSSRYADSAAITPDGRFVAFTFRPVPIFSGSSETQLCLNDTTEQDRVDDGSVSITDNGNANLSLRTLGRSAMDASATFFFIETNDGLAGFDTNAASDIYRIDATGNFLRVSAANGVGNEVGEAVGKGARDPVLTGDGSKLFFISERQLRPGDTDGGTTIYRSTADDNFNLPSPILTEVRPLALSRQATGNGDYLVFLGQPKKGAARPYLLNVNTGTLTELAASAPVAGGAPAISADNHIIAYSTAAVVATSPATDRNGAVDVAVTENPELAQLPLPVVTLVAPTDGTVITTSQTASLAASTTNPGGTVIFTAVEVDGVIFNSRNGTSVPAGNFALGLGIHKIRALAITRDGLVAQTPLRTLIVRTASGVAATGLNSLTQTPRADGSVDFTASLRVDNANTGSRNVRVHFIETLPGAEWEIFGVRPDDGENRLLETVTLTLPASGTGNFVITSNVGAPQIIADADFGEMFTGVGRRVVALVQAMNGSFFTNAGDLFTVLEVRPRLDEDTPGPNGGVPVLNGPIAAPFNPLPTEQLTAVNIVGSTSVPEKTTVTYRANAVFSVAGTRPCTPVWSVGSGGTFATIAPNGVLTLGDVPAPRTIQVTAVFGGVTAMRVVTVQPVSPTVSVVASDKTAAEQVAGTTPLNRGAFKLVRNPAQTSPLTVNYSISGTARPGNDYVALSGTATFPAKAGTVVVPVDVLNDGFFEGNETVIVTVTPTEEYRAAKVSTATVTIADNEPVPAGQPDAVIKRGRAIGANVFSNDSARQQSVLAKGVRNVAAVFTAEFVNRTEVETVYTITGAGDFLGFRVQYLSGKVDVTEAVQAGTFEVTVPAQRTANLTLKITPTDDTPLQSVMRCVISVQDRLGTGFLDTVEAMIQRVR